MRRAMMIDLDRCIGCLACVSACKEQWDTGRGGARCWVTEYEHGTRGKDLGVTFYPGLCMQCAEHPCTEDCPTGATYRNERGVVVVDPEVCIGCGNCVSSCAYGARFADPDKKIVEKCNLCEPLLERGEEPACVATCLAHCRHVGDLDDPDGELSRLIREKNAKPLATPEVNIGPAVTYAGDAHRAQVLAHNVVAKPEKSWLTKVWAGWTRPLARVFVPAVAVVSVVGGVMANLFARRERNRAAQEKEAGGGEAPAPDTAAEPLPRHRAGMRFLHWFNLLSWLVLVLTGTALMSASSFALFGESYPRWLTGLLGGKAALIRLHVLWGITWAAIIIPMFLVYKKGGMEALREIVLTKDDFVWLARKPLAMFGRARKPLPPQDKYNAGQKIFALTAVLGTATIVLTGLVMTFHWGSATVVAGAVLVHKLAIAFALLGLAVHVTMAAVIKDERPALKSMVTGKIDREHAAHHSEKWVKDVDRGTGPAADARTGRRG